MLLYLQPTKDVDQRRCFVSEPSAQGADYSELDFGSVSLTSAKDEPSAPVCVHLSPTVTLIYLVLE